MLLHDDNSDIHKGQGEKEKGKTSMSKDYHFHHHHPSAFRLNRLPVQCTKLNSDRIRTRSATHKKKSFRNGSVVVMTCTQSECAQSWRLHFSKSLLVKSKETLWKSPKKTFKKPTIYKMVTWKKISLSLLWCDPFLCFMDVGEWSLVFFNSNTTSKTKLINH